MADRTRNDTERRVFTRIRLGLEVAVRMKDRSLGRFRTRDLDMGGLFVEAGEIDLYPNDIAELAFPDAAGKGRGHVFRAKVIRHAANGVGLMFHEHDEDSLAALRDVMLAAMPAADAYATIAGGSTSF